MVLDVNDGASFVTIENCRVSNFSYDGIVISGSKQYYENCDYSKLGETGIEVDGGTSAELQ